MGLLIRLIGFVLIFLPQLGLAQEATPREPQSADVFPRIPSPRFLASGERRVVDIVMTNPGDEMNFYTLSIERKPEGWIARVDPRNVDLAPHEEAPIHITLIPKSGPPSFTEQMTQYDVVIKAEDKEAKPFIGPLSVYLKPGYRDMLTFFGIPALIGFVAIGIGGRLRRRRHFRVGGLFVMGGGILAVVSVTAVLGILVL
ncbi:MAG: hypothetical protein EPO39_05470 [Candidatus Manganitrophaceae bacterium]|nr:MAG: hypothetical protein EPO39_05470 [Candidatus Manganitrophaceae bacterium]